MQKSFELYVTAVGVTDDKQKRVLLLHIAGPRVQEIFETLRDTSTDVKTASEKLDEYFKAKKNISFERHVFRQATQTPGESMDSYVSRLRKLASRCNFGNLQKR